MSVRSKRTTALGATRLFGGTYLSTAVGLSCTAFYSLDELSGTTMGDTSGNSRNGTYSGATLGAAPLYAGSTAAATGGGTGQGVGSVTSAAWMSPAAFTVAFFVKPNNTNDIVGLVSRYGSGGWLFWQRSGLLSFLINLGGTDHNLAGPSFSSGTTYHLAGTWDGATQSLYVNGLPFSSQSLSGSYANSADLELGGYGGNANRSLATLDGVSHHSVAMSASDVAALYAARSG